MNNTKELLEYIVKMIVDRPEFISQLKFYVKRKN